MPERGGPVVVLGLDSVPPGLLFGTLRPWMPRLGRWLERARFGTLRSCDPPITVPAWAVMFTGVDPGSLGLYGFRHRRRGTYFDQYTPTPSMLRAPPLWEVASRRGLRVAVLGMPPGYPPPAVNGVYVADFLTPDGARDAVRPDAYREVVERRGYRFDVRFRAEDRPRVADELLEMARQHWGVARELWARERWDLFVVHDITPDRLHHAFWKYIDRAHPRYEERAEYAALFERHYRALDDELGSLLDALGPQARVLVASDHGSQGMDGCFCINEWLLAEGFLSLRAPVARPGTPLDEADVDWERTVAWGAGGYYARLFLNVRGREPKGRVRPEEVTAWIDRLAEGLARVRLPNGAPLAPVVRRPSELYREVTGDPPDALAYFGGLRWRSAGTLGHRRLFLEENDTGPDDSVHSMDGVFAAAGPGLGPPGPVREQSILDIAPTLLGWLGLAPERPMQGRAIAELAGGAAPRGGSRRDD